MNEYNDEINNSDIQYQPAVQPEIPETKKKKNKSNGISRILVTLYIFGALLIGGASGGAISIAYLKNNTTTSGTSQPTTTTKIVNTNSTGVEAVVETAASSVVEITTVITSRDMFGRQVQSEGAGSGVILTSDGYIVTNYHVIEGATSVTVRLTDGTTYDATVVGSDEDEDIAVLKIDATGLTAVTFADSDAIQVGEQAVAIGNPLGTLGGTVTEGIISAKDREITINDVTMTLLQTSAAVNSGNSGGGLFDSTGHLIGIVNAKSSGTTVEGLGFAIPSNTVKEVIESIIQLNLVVDYTL